MEHRRVVQFDIAFLAQLARKRCQQRLSLLDPATRQMPPGDIGVLDQEHAPFAVQNQAADTNRKAARESPINVENHANKRLQAAANSTQWHPAIRLRSG